MNCSNCTNPAGGFDHGTTSTSMAAPVTYLTLSVIGIIANIFLSLVIAMDKDLRSPCFKLIFASGIGSLVLAISCAQSAADRFEFWSDFNRSRIFCQFMSGFLLKVGAILFNSQVSFLIAADRLLGLVSPFKYRRRGKWFCLIGLIVSVIIGLIEMLYLVFNQPPTEILATCANTALVHGLVFRQVLSGSNFFFCALCVVSYAAMMVFFHLQKSQLNDGNGSDAEKQLFVKQYNAIMPAAKLLCALYILLGITPEIMFGVINALSLFGGVLHITAEQIKASSTLVEIISLSLRSQQFRQGAQRLFKRDFQNSSSVKSIQVQPMSVLK